MTKRLLRKSALFTLFLSGLLGKSPDAKGQAYDVIYQDTLPAASLSQMSHSFSFFLYQNCNPAPQNFASLPVMYRTFGTPVNELINSFPVVGMGNLFCAGQAPVCSVTGPVNYQKSGVKYTFSGKANLSTPGIYTLETRFTLAGPFGNFQAANIAGNFGIEPNVLNVVAPGLTNLPPAFINPPVIFANVNQPVSYSCAAIDPDGDSLVYRLRPVNNSATYAAGFTYLNPITANPALALNSRTGVLNFKPTVYDPVAGPGATANKYMVGIDVEEYRNTNGGSMKIATFQRNVLINVISQVNQSPGLTAQYLDMAAQTYIPVAPNTILDVYPGQQVTMVFGASDPDATNYVSPSSNVRSVLFGSSFAVTLAQNPNAGVLYWTPSAADARDEPYFFNVTAQDDACPYPASITHTYGIRVRNITGLKPENSETTGFLAYPNPATNVVNFRISGRKPVQEIVICNLLGREIDRIAVDKAKSGEQTLRWENAANFAAGTYVARLVAADKTLQTLKFTKLQ